MLFLVLAYLAAALTGLLLAIGANTLADRVVSGEEFPWSARQCRKCGVRLTSPGIVSLQRLVLPRQTCPSCGKPLSLRRPLVELGMAALLPLLLAHLLTLSTPTRLTIPAIFALDALALGVFAFIFVVDLEHHLIFDLTIYPLGALALLVAILFDHKALAAIIFGAIISGGLFLGFYGLGFLLYRQEALGFGDVTLATLIGILVGWPTITGALLLAGLAAAASSMLLIGLGRVSRRTYIPYGTFLTLGATLAILYSHPFW